MFLSNTFRALRHRDYFIFWFGMLLGHNGSLIQTTAAGWLILELTDSPFYLGLYGFCLGFPRTIFSPIGGAVVDRVNRRSLFNVTQSVFLLMALFLGMMNYTGLIHVWHVLIVTAVTGFILSFEQPVRQSILHQLVPQADLINAVSLYNLIFNGSPLVGPAIAGVLITVIGTAGCFFFHAAGSAIILVTIFLIHIPQRPAETQRKSLRKDVTEGLSVAWNTPIFFALFSALAVISFFTKPYNQFMPVFARDILFVGAPGLGFLLMAPGAGAVFGGLVFASIRRFPRTHILMAILACGFGASLVLFTFSRSFPLSLAFLFLTGVFQTAFLTLTATSLQVYSRDATRGRMMALFGLLNRGIGPMGAFPMGTLASRIGAPITIAFGALLGVAMTVYVTLWSPHLRKAAVLGESTTATREKRG